MTYWRSGRTTFRRFRGGEGGFSLIELMVVVLIASLLAGLGAWAFRGYWYRRSLDNSAKGVTAQLRQLHQRAVAESHPLIYGARFTEGRDEYTLFRYNPSNSVSPCSQLNTVDLVGGVETASGTSFTTSPYIDLSDCPMTGGADHFVFFFARGTATDGTLVLTNERLPDASDTATIRVTQLTGRVESGY
jgi:prepilin-type N-terminal cleavage/methylation domain-containing protein